MKDFFEELFEYHRYFNQKIIVQLLEYPHKFSEKAILLLNHSLNAHQIWNSRVLEEKSFEVFEIHSTNELMKINETNFRNSIEILKNIDLSKTITYSNSKGQKFKNSVTDIMFQIINHTTYHRAQISSELKQNGIEPFISDYIFYKREELN